MGSPVDEPGLVRAGRGERPKAGAVAVNDCQAELVTLLEPEDDLLPIGRERAGEGVLRFRR